MKIAILGFGREGKAVLKFLKTQKNADKISILDKKLDKNYLKNLADFDIVFRSPGVPYNLPEIQKAVKKGVKFSSATQLFFEQLRNINQHLIIIGITGTKGKGTTSTLLYKILKAAGNNTYLAGNIGKPAIELLSQIKRRHIGINQRKNQHKLTFIILELSSFQLQDLKYSPDIAVVLNVFEDHLDSHKNFMEYINAKANIAKWQKKSDKIFYDASNKWSSWIAQKSRAKKIPIKISFFNSSKWWSEVKSNLKIPGVHNLKNILMAISVAQSLGVNQKIIQKTIKNYRGMKHRLELIRKISINQRQNSYKSTFINFYNDSASTNPYTAVAAIKAFPNQPKILIAGGKDKGLDYSPLAKALRENNETKLVILFGENKKKITRTIFRSKNQELRIKEVKDLKEAVNLAYKTAKTLLVNGCTLNPVIIFSPASASFDMFKDYKDRGKKFKEIVKKLK